MDDRELTPWRLIGAAAQGRSHKTTGTRCQDFSQHATIGDVAIAAVSDGAGSADLAHLGSSIAVKAVVAALLADAQIRPPSLDGLRRAFSLARDAVESDAVERGRMLRDYACTLLVVVATTERTFLAQIGDGAIVGVLPDGEMRALTWPQQGEYVNATVFLIQHDVEPIFLEEEPLEAFALFSDGLQNVALEYSSRTAYAPFFLPFLDALRAKDAKQAELELHLAMFLEHDPHLGSRTDDDLSLIVAVRQ